MPASATLAPLLLDLLALLALHPGQEVGEVRIRLRARGWSSGTARCCAAIQPPGSPRRARCCARPRRRTAGAPTTGPASRRQLPHRAAAAAARAGGIAGQQPRAAGHRRERHGVQQLGVVVQAVALVGIGPGPVEDVFAVGVVLQVQRAGGDQFARFRVQRQELRRPAGGGYGALRGVQRRQVLVAHERRWRGLAARAVRSRRRHPGAWDRRGPARRARSLQRGGRRVRRRLRAPRDVIGDGWAAAAREGAGPTRPSADDPNPHPHVHAGSAHKLDTNLSRGASHEADHRDRQTVQARRSA